MDRPLLTVTEAAALAFPDTPPRLGARRLYRWHSNGILPPGVILRAGRAIYLRRAAFTAWLESGRADGAVRGTR